MQNPAVDEHLTVQLQANERDRRGADNHFEQGRVWCGGLQRCPKGTNEKDIARPCASIENKRGVVKQVGTRSEVDHHRDARRIIRL